MGRYDDETILPSWTLIRGIRSDWIETDPGGKETIQSRAFDESNQETSCFILEETNGTEGFRNDILPLIETELGAKLRFAIIPVEFVRSCGFWIYRKPEEFHGNSAHVVICPQQSANISRNQFKRHARELAKNAELQPL